MSVNILIHRDIPAMIAASKALDQDLMECRQNQNQKIMTLLKMNDRPTLRTFDGLVKDLFGDIENILDRETNSGKVPVNIVETKDGYHLELLAPGRSKDQFNIKVEAQLLTIGFEAPNTAAPADVRQIRKEFNIKSFTRSFTLDEKIATDGILAKYEDGILKLYLPKKEEVIPAVKQIPIG